MVSSKRDLDPSVSGPVELRALTEDGLEDFAALLGSDDFGGCFCAVWTSFDATWGRRCQDPARPNLAITCEDVSKGRRAGFFIVVGQEIAGWLGAGPKTDFPTLETRLGSRLSPFSPETWSVGCLAISGPYRGRGLGEAAVRALAAKAFYHGAKRVEAYPTRPWDEPRSYRGALSMYSRIGFELEGAEADGDSEILLAVLSR